MLRNRDWPNGVKPTDENMHRSEDHIYVEKQNNTIFILRKKKQNNTIFIFKSFQLQDTVFISLKLQNAKVQSCVSRIGVTRRELGPATSVRDPTTSVLKAV